jgi:hypothetical protein
MNANIKKMQIFKVNKGQKAHLKIFKSSFVAKYFCLKANLFKTFQECQQYEDKNCS